MRLIKASNHKTPLNYILTDQVQMKRKSVTSGHKISIALQPVFVTKKLEQELKPKEIKPSTVNPQCVFFFHVTCVMQIIWATQSVTFNGGVVVVGGGGGGVCWGFTHIYIII